MRRIPSSIEATAPANGCSVGEQDNGARAGGATRQVTIALWTAHPTGDKQLCPCGRVAYDIMMSEERRSEGARLLLAILARRRKVPEATERRPAGGGEEAEKLCLFVLSKLAHQLDDAQTKTR